jgi:hypothetical protein
MAPLMVSASGFVIASLSVGGTQTAEKPEVKARIAMKESSSWDGKPYPCNGYTTGVGADFATKVSFATSLALWHHLRRQGADVRQK